MFLAGFRVVTLAAPKRPGVPHHRRKHPAPFYTIFPPSILVLACAYCVNSGKFFQAPWRNQVIPQLACVVFSTSHASSRFPPIVLLPYSTDEQTARRTSQTP